MVTKKARQGRPKSIDHALFGTVFRLNAEGRGYRAISNHLTSLGVDTSKSSVERLIKGHGAYKDRQMPRGRVS